jgi:competence protein ComEC
VRTAAAIPALGLLSGSALGLLAPGLSSFGGAVMCGCAVAALWAWCVSRPAVLSGAVCLAFLGGAAMLASQASRRASDPPLRRLFHDLAQIERLEALADGRAPPLDDEAFVIIEGELRADAALTPAGVSLSLDVDGLDGPVRLDEAVHSGGSRPSPSRLGGVIVTAVGSIAQTRVTEWRAGRRVRFPASLHRAARYLDPGVPDLEQAVARRGTTLVGTVKSGALVDLLARGSAADEAFAAARLFSRRAIDASVGRWSPRSGAIVSAIVIGDRAGLDEDVQRRLQEAGTYHVIAISGGNIAILAGLLLGAFRLAGALGRPAMIAAVALLLAYAGFVDGGASVDRATLMAVVYFGARALDHRTAPLNSLALAAGALVAFQPLSIADAGFLMTFGATLAILLAAPLVPRRPMHWALRAAFVTLTASAATELLLFPMGAMVFSRVTFAGLALNFFAIPLMTLTELAGMAVIPAFAVSTQLAAGAGWIAHAGAEGLVRSAGLIRFAPFATWRVAPPGPVVVAGYYVAVAVAWLLWHRRRGGHLAGSGIVDRAIGASVTAAGLFAVWMLAQPWTIWSAWGNPTLRVTFIDVGQGDAVFIRFPHGQSMLVDAGGVAGSAFDVGDRVVAPVLRDAGIRRLDYLALTHGDPDHIGGAASIIAEFRPRAILEGISVPRAAALAALRVAADEAGSAWTSVRRGDRFVIDEVVVRVLHPAEPDWERQRVRNDDSIVLELAWRDASFLLTGDIGREVEHELPAFTPATLRVLKVPHHGSLTSSSEAFLELFKPSIVVASAGRLNHFGHPAPAVLARYLSIGAQVYRTDRDGAVTVGTDGRSLSVHRFVEASR